MWTKTEDGSVETTDGKVVYFSADRFLRDICHGDCCFICGAAPDSKLFNDEHVLPEWLLRRYGLFDNKITIPNGDELHYRRYTVPCCQECNTKLGRVIEEPISAALSVGEESINAYLASDGHLKLWAWLGLIFLKTHLKDKQRRVHADSRLGDQKIADEYDWPALHHIHSVVRAIINGYSIDGHTIGSILIWPIVTNYSAETFDYMDLHVAQTIFIRVGSLGLFTVFNDSGAVLNTFRQKLDKIDGPLSELQAREILVELAWLNLHIVERPTHATYYDLMAEKCWIGTKLPDLRWEPWDSGLRSMLLAHAFRHIDARAIGNITREELEVRIAEGTLTFLFDENNVFIRGR